MRVAGLLGANALIFCIGLGVLPWLGVARSWRRLVSRCGLAYLCGLVVTGILGAGVAAQHRFDPQAKALGEWLRSRHLDIPEALL